MQYVKAHFNNSYIEDYQEVLAFDDDMTYIQIEEAVCEWANTDVAEAFMYLAGDSQEYIDDYTNSISVHYDFIRENEFNTWVSEH